MRDPIAAKEVLGRCRNLTAMEGGNEENAEAVFVVPLATFALHCAAESSTTRMYTAVPAKNMGVQMSPRGTRPWMDEGRANQEQLPRTLGATALCA
jgi:hypothetical protein